ncbi:MAG TPA: hypothetical protein VFL13_04145 [Candidatus Baltobacteraceae bacterium]|nr:hypothetical protein [Candidatus Baltobacteraceae bacterium]
MQFVAFIKKIDGFVRRQCPAAQVSVYDHSQARWSCGGNVVALEVVKDAFKLTIEHQGIVLYQAVDVMDEAASVSTAQSIAQALQEAAS